MSQFKKLIVWQKSVDFVTDIYTITKTFPEDEKFCLVSQMRRAAVSIPSNIAEGVGRKGNGELIHFLKIAFASSSELETQLIIAHRLQFVRDTQYNDAIERITILRKMLNKLISNKLKD